MDPWYQIAIKWGIWLTKSVLLNIKRWRRKKCTLKTHTHTIKKDSDSLFRKYALNCYATCNTVECHTSSETFL